MAYATTSQGIFHLLSHSIFLIWPHFYDKFLEKYICLIFLPHFTTTAYGLHHSRYGFWQVHFRHLILHVRLLSNMIIDIHCDLCIWMVFAPLRSMLNGCPPDIQHPITYCITLGLTLFSPNLVHPVWRRVCGCVKYRTKKFYFFLPKTIWRFHQVVPAPLLSSDKSFLSCSSYLCSEKISSKFHSISISSWLWTRITLITSRSFSVSNFWIPKKSFSFILSESSFCSRSKS